MGSKLRKRIRVKNNEQDSLRYHLHKHLAGIQEARGTKRVHASEMQRKMGTFGSMDGQFCPREYALLDTLGKSRPDEFLGTCQRSTFNLGNMMGDWVVHQFADIGLAIGDWKCKHCDKYYAFQKRPDECNNCGHGYFKHEEVRFESTNTGISCGVDMLRKTSTNKLQVVEIKSIKDADFKITQAPLAEHNWRTNLYLRIIADSDSPYKKRIITDKAVVLYIAKTGWGIKDKAVTQMGFKDLEFSPFKEFPVIRKDSLTQKKWEHAKILYKFRNGESGMPLGLCETQFVERAKGCSVCSECFSGKYKAGK